MEDFVEIPDQIHLIDLEQDLVNEWRIQFRDCNSRVEVHSCDYFDIPADCIVSPANSFGYMDGGLDRVIAYEFGEQIQDKVQAAILDEYYGELPIGSAVIVETGFDNWPYLIAAPTMRIPEDVSNSLNAYLAFRAILLSIAKFNTDNQGSKIDSLVCSGLASGIGKLGHMQCALQMKIAYESFLSPPQIMTPKAI